MFASSHALPYCRIHASHYNMGGDKYDKEVAEVRRKVAAHSPRGAVHGEQWGEPRVGAS